MSEILSFTNKPKAMNTVTTIAIFYDGNFFNKISFYYKQSGRPESWINIEGLHEFIKVKVAELWSIPLKNCEIVTAHLFAGRPSARDSNIQAQRIRQERLFDEMLTQNRVECHYLPLVGPPDDRREKGVDVLLALESYEICMNKRIDVAVLIMGDGDFMALPAKLHSLHCSTVLLAWNINHSQEGDENTHSSHTSSYLRNRVSHVVEMDTIIDQGFEAGDRLITAIFNAKKDFDEEASEPNLNNVHTGKIVSLRSGYGFISFPPHKDVHFESRHLRHGLRFDDLKKGDKLSFKIVPGEKGQYTARDIHREEPQ